MPTKNPQTKKTRPPKPPPPATAPSNSKSKIKNQKSIPPSPNQKSEILNPKSRRTILLAVSGMSPAILTETVWALAHETPPVIPDEVVVITTTRGATDLQAALLTPKPEWGGRSVWECLHQAIADTAARGARSGQFLQLGVARVIELPEPKSGIKRPAADLRSAADNEAAADFILEEVRRLAENPDVRLIASIAGGRKTMGALVYAAMSLLGHETDRVTHVLVNEPFENCRDFFYPGQPGQTLSVGTGADRRELLAADAKIELANVPFVPLRNLFERDLAKKPGTFAMLVEGCSRRLADLARQEVRLEVLADRPEVRVNEASVPLSVAEYVLLLHLAEAASAGNPAIDGYDAASVAVAKTAERLFQQHDKNDFSDWHYKALPSGKGFEEINQRWITKNLSSLREKLRSAGPQAAALIPLLPERNRFSLDLPATSITLL